MGESVLKPFMIAFTFVMVAILLTAYASRISASHGISTPGFDSGYGLLAGWEYDLWNPDAGYAVNTTVQITDPYHILYEHSSHDIGVFWPDGEDSGYREVMRAWLLRDNDYEGQEAPARWQGGHIGGWCYQINDWFGFKDALIWSQNQGSFWASQWWYFGVTLDEIVSRGDQNMTENKTTATIPFMMGDLNFTMFITANTPDPVSETFEHKIYASEFTVQLGRTWMDTLNETGRTSMWGLVGKILTLDIPDTPKPISYLIGVPIWICIGFIAVTIISRFIPLIPGG